MTNIIVSLSRASARIIEGSGALASIFIFLVMIWVTADVIGRVVFNSPITGTAEIIKVGVVCVVFMQIPFAVLTRRMIMSELIVGRFSGIPQIIATLFRDLLTLACFLFICFANWEPMLHAWKILQYEGEGALSVPVYPLFTFIQIGSTVAVLISIKFVFDGIRAFLAARKR
ncbi:MAG: TRAP transporter small permease [Bacteroidota bacterium]